MKKVLVTGATRGIGREIAVELSAGYEVFVTGRDENLLKELVKTTNVKDYFAIDLTSLRSCEKIYNKFNDIDILINNAGGYIYKELGEYEEQEVENLFKLNSISPFMLTSLYSKKMKEKGWGRIINIGSISAMIGESGAALYSASKGSLISLSKAAALELAPYGVTVNTVHPGWVDTDLGQKSIAESDFSVNEIIETIPQRRFITPNEIANLIKYLISNEAKGLTGQNINLCAGLTIG